MGGQFQKTEASRTAKRRTTQARPNLGSAYDLLIACIPFCSGVSFFRAKLLFFTRCSTLSKSILYSLSLFWSSSSIWSCLSRKLFFHALSFKKHSNARQSEETVAVIAMEPSTWERCSWRSCFSSRSSMINLCFSSSLSTTNFQYPMARPRRFNRNFETLVVCFHNSKTIKLRRFLWFAQGDHRK